MLFFRFIDHSWASKASCAFVTMVGVYAMGASALLGATRSPIRNTGSVETPNSQQVQNPIYHPIPASQAPDQSVAPETLLHLFMERHTATEYESAVEAALTLCELIPDRPEGYYNLACALSRLHRVDEALDALQKSVDMGWRDLVHLNLDPDLANIRTHKRFDEIVSNLKAAIEREKISPMPLREEPWQEVSVQLRASAPQHMAKHHVPGAAVALVRDGEVVWSESFGVRDRRSSDVLDARDRFRVRAPLHLLAMIAAGQQQAVGRVQLAKLLEDGVLLDQPQRASRDRRQPAIESEVSNVGTASGTSSARDRRRRHCERQPNYSSNSVYGLVKLAIEMASDQSFAAYCNERIMGPLTMQSTSFSRLADQTIAFATGHSQLGSPMDPDPQSEEVLDGGAMYTTAHDLAQLMNEIMQASRVSQQHSLKQQQGEPPHSPAIDVDGERQVQVCVPWVFDLVEEADALIPHGLGLAIQVEKTEFGKRIEVADTVSGMGCLMRWYPEKNCGVVVLYNSATGAPAARQIAHEALGGG